MANWIVAMDEDERRLQAFGAQAERCVAPVQGLEVGKRSGAGWMLAWAAGARAPVDVHTHATGLSICWGEPRDEAGTLQSAPMIQAAWSDAAFAQWDGFYCALSVDQRQRSVIVGTDVLGIFPVYYWSDGRGVVLVGSSAELFRMHPGFTATLNPAGLIGILLTNGLVGGETLWKGVTRLGAGRRLLIADGVAREMPGYQFPAEAEAADLPLQGHVEMLADAVSSAVRRHAPSGRHYGLLLSGGLDSRILAGFLAEQNARVDALTFGLSTDVEMRCARRVARFARFPHSGREIPASEYPQAAQRLARWESLSNGFGGLIEWAAPRHLTQLGDRVITGHVMDGVIGGLHLHWAYDEDRRSMTFDKLFSMVNQWGFDPATVKSMLQPGLSGLVDECIRHARLAHDESAPVPHHRAWIFDIQHRMRFHVGGSLWPLSFSCWPVLPVLDRAVIAAAAALPCSSIAGRRAQRAMLVSRFPGMARLPLDRNSFDSRPLVASGGSELRHYFSFHMHRLRARALGLVGIAEQEQLYYRRIFDLNTPGWRLVRKLASPEVAVPEVLRQGAIAAQLPGPHADLETSMPISSRSRAMLLLGLNLRIQQIANT